MAPTDPAARDSYALSANPAKCEVAWLRGLLLTAGLVLAFAAAARDCSPTPAGLVGWWPGEGNAKDVAGTNNGTLQGGATASVAGVVGSAFGFDGTNGYVRIPDAPELRPTNLTVEAWVRFNSLDSAVSGGSFPGQQYVVFKQNSRNDHFEGFFLGKGRFGTRDFYVFGVSSASGQAAELNSSATVITGAWCHVAGVRGSNFIQLYVNGQLDSQTNVNFPQDYGTNALYFGTSGQAYWDHKLQGALDEVSLYSRALAPDEIAGIYAAGSLGKCQAPGVLVQPPSQIRYWGSSATFTSSVSGTQPLSYQWRKDGLAVAGATASSLTLTNLQVTNAGGYAVWVTSASGNATSPPALLSIKVADVSIALSAAGPQTVAGLTIGGVVSQRYGIKQTANLSPTPAWVGVTNVTLTAPTNVWYDPTPATLPRRSYQVVPGPISIP
jgi:hypothetical protein